MADPSGTKLPNIPLSAIGVGVSYPGRRLQNVIPLEPTDDGGRTVIPVGHLAGQEDLFEFDVIISLPSGDETVRLENLDGFVARTGSVAVTIVEVMADAPEINAPTVTIDSESTNASINSLVSEIVVCDNADSRIKWRIESVAGNGQFVSDIVLGEPVPGFINTSMNGGFVGTSGEINPPLCPFQVIGASGFTLGILGPFYEGDFKLSNVFLTFD